MMDKKEQDVKEWRNRKVTLEKDFVYKYTEAIAEANSAYLPVIEESKLLLSFKHGEIFSFYLSALYQSQPDIKEDVVIRHLYEVFRMRWENIQNRIKFYKWCHSNFLVLGDELNLPTLFNYWNENYGCQPTLEKIMRVITPKSEPTEREEELKETKKRINKALKKGVFVNFTATEENRIIEKIDKPL
jgi:hypothetical protein